MRLRFLGSPRVSKSSHLVVDSAAACKVEHVENAEAAVASTLPPVPENDMSSVRQLRQRRVGVGLWAIRRQKLERAQLRPRIVVHMSRLRGRKTAANFGTANIRKKCQPRRASSAIEAVHTITTDAVTPPDVAEMRNGTSVVAHTRMDASSGFKLEQPEEDGVRDDVDNGRMRDQETDEKPSGDAVKLRPKRHIMHKKMVSA